MNEVEYECLKRKVRQLIQIDLNNYKENQMIRRLDGFISRAKTTDILQYCARLDNDPAEMTKLRSFITINVSEFYRDLMHFETLRRSVLTGAAEKQPQTEYLERGVLRRGRTLHDSRDSQRTYTRRETPDICFGHR